jgi:hypothetical protein
VVVIPQPNIGDRLAVLISRVELQVEIQAQLVIFNRVRRQAVAVVADESLLLCGESVNLATSPAPAGTYSRTRHRWHSRGQRSAERCRASRIELGSPS